MPPNMESPAKVASAYTESEVGSVLSSSGRKRRRGKQSEPANNVCDIIQAAEEENMARIRDMLAGNMDLQTLCIHMLEKNLLRPQRKTKIDEPTAAASTNKFSLLSVENWADILSMFDGVVFEKEQLLKLKKEMICKMGCMAGGLDPASALCSRRLRVIASLMKRRSSDIFADRYTRVKLVVDEDTEQIVEHDFSQNGKGVFDVTLSADKKSGTITHIGTGREVAIPAEMIENGPKIYDNYSESTAYFKGNYSNPLISMVYEKAGAKLPKLFWLKKITDYVDPSLTEEALGSLAGATEAAGAAPAAAPATSSDPPPDRVPMPPAGDGGAEPPPVSVS